MRLRCEDCEWNESSLQRMRGIPSRPLMSLRNDQRLPARKNAATISRFLASPFSQMLLIRKRLYYVASLCVIMLWSASSAISRRSWASGSDSVLKLLNHSSSLNVSIFIKLGFRGDTLLLVKKLLFFMLSFPRTKVFTQILLMIVHQKIIAFHYQNA